MAKSQHIRHAWEKMLISLRMWVCCRCLHLHAWRISCKGKEGSIHKDIIAGPFNGEGDDFLFHGLDFSAESSAVGQGFSEVTVASEGNDVDVVAESACSLSTEVLNSVLQRQFQTVTCIPH